MTHKVLAILCACTLLGACASAEPPPPRGTINVFISPAGEPFRAGKDEPYPVDLWFNRADTDHDGALSQDEFVADAVSFFHKLDVNGDGVVDGFEVSDYEQKIAPEILPRIAGLTARDIPPLPAPRDLGVPVSQQQQDQQQQPEEPRRVGPSMNGAGFYSLIQESEPVAAADADFDGKVTLDEFKAAARRKFGELDPNHDGRLERSELRKTQAQRLVERQTRKGEEKSKHP